MIKYKRSNRKSELWGFKINLGLTSWFKTKRKTLVLLDSSNYHALVFFSLGGKKFESFYTSQKFRSYLFVALLQIPYCFLMLTDGSAANRALPTLLSCMCNGRLFINIQNRRGPRMLPGGTHVCMVPTAEIVVCTNIMRPF